MVVRRLPPTMAVEQFLDQVSPVPEHNYFRSVLKLRLNRNMHALVLLS